MKTLAPTSRTVRKQGFTLIEILVALSVTALMVTLMVNITIGVLNVWNRSSGTLTTGNQARTLMDQIAQDLQGAIFKRDGNVWLAATVQKDQSGLGDAGYSNAKWTKDAQPNASVKPGYLERSLDLAATRTGGTDALATEDQNKLENVRFGQAGVWLRFFTNVSGSDQTNPQKISAPRAVSYQICRVKIGSTLSDQVGYSLYRSEVRPDYTFTNGYTIIAPAYDQPAALSSEWDAATIRKPHGSRIIANNVVDFGVRLLEKNAANELIEKFPATRLGTGALVSAPATAPVNYLVTSSATPTYTSYGSTVTPTTGFPVVAEVMVRILTQEGVNKLQAFESGKVTAPAGTTDAEYWWALAEQNSNVFIRRVEIKSTAL